MQRNRGRARWKTVAAAATDPAVLTYIAAVQAAGGTVTGPQAAALTTFAISTRATGVWAKLQEVGLFLGGTVASAAVKLKFPVAQNCVLNGVVVGDLTSKGLVTDGSTKWVDTATTFNQLTGTGYIGMGLFLTAECATTAFGVLMGTDAGSAPQIGLRWNPSPGTVDCLIDGLGASQPVMNKPRATLPIGLMSGQRVVTGNNFTIYQGGLPASLSTGSTFSHTASAAQIAVSSGSSGNNKVPLSIGMYFMCDGTMTDADHRALTLATNKLMVSLGRVVPDARALNYIPIIGQSLAVGSGGTPVLSSSQPYKNVSVGTGVQGNLGQATPAYWYGNIAGTGYQAGDLTPMVEVSVETLASGAANTVGKLARADGLGSAQDLLTMNFAVGATAYSGLAKGTIPYQDNIDTSAFAPIPGQLFASGAINVPALWCVHGESDMLNGSYGANIRQWQVDYETDMKAITGQSGTIPIFHSQPSCWTAVANVNSATGIAPYQILSEYETNPTKTVLVCPKYFFSYQPADGVHLLNTSYRLLGEYYAKAYYQHVVKGIPWSPLRPTTIQRTGAVITVTFSGNVGNLQFDTTNVTDPSGATATKGFEYTDSAGGSIYTRIASVALSLPNQVVITLTADPSANTGKTLSYAYTGTPGQLAGPTTGPRGNLKDSDTTTGQSGTALPNWCVHFQKAVP